MLSHSSYYLKSDGRFLGNSSEIFDLYDSVKTAFDNRLSLNYIDGLLEPEVHYKEYTEIELRLTALNSGLYPTLDALGILQERLPPLAWSKRCFNGGEEARDCERFILDSYIGNRHRLINSELKAFPSRYALLNETIARLPPLERGVIAYKYTNDLHSLQGGYLSLTFLPPSIPTLSKYMIEVEIPPGKRAIHVGMGELELILPHGTVLERMGEERRTLIHFSGRTKLYEHRLYEYTEETLYSTEIEVVKYRVV